MENQPDELNQPQVPDRMLNHALLDDERLFNEETLETMAQHVFAAGYTANPDAQKEKEILASLTRKFTEKTNRFWLNAGILVLVAGGIIAAFLLVKPGKQEPLVQQVLPLSPLSAQQSVSLTREDYEAIEGLTPTVTPPAPIAGSSDEDSTGDSAEAKKTQVPQQAMSFYPGTNVQYRIKDEENWNYEEVPVLSADKIKQTAKDKLKILRDITKKKSYGYIPAGSMFAAGKVRSLNGFSIKLAEVTNFEYRTFLNDLIVEGRQEEYLQARPVKDGWAKQGLPRFDAVYFESEKYNEFPAVNMSRRGAELYCEWMTRSLCAAIKSKEVKWSEKGMPDFRLPNNAEWIYAVRACDSANVKYPWGKIHPDSLQNSKGCFLCNFNYTLSKDQVRNTCPFYAKNKQTGTHQPVITTAGMAIDTLVTAPVYSYNPNDKGLYCTMGNVSEMVWTWQGENTSVKGEARAMGGNWNSPVYNVCIEAPEQYVGVTEASALIGFRPVMILNQ